MWPLYLIALGAFLLIGGVLFIFRTFVKKVDYSLIRKIITLVIAAVFAVRYMSFKEIQIMGKVELDSVSAAIGKTLDFTIRGGGPFEYIWQNQIGNVLIWFEIAAFLMIVLEPFFDSKAVKFISLYCATPLIVLPLIGMPLMYGMMTGMFKIGLTYILFGIEVGGLLALNALNWLVNWKTKFYSPTIIKGIIAAVLILIFSVPTYLPASLFGYASPFLHVKEISFTHRVFIYAFILIPPLPIYFFLRSQSKAFIRYTLLAITTGVMIIFVAFTKYDAFFEPWRWPIHLCNTVLFVMPLCFIFKPKRLFYFTYFINVFGALFAILMPNTDLTENMMDPDIWRFWYNHAIAFWMPLLAVALGVYEKPKLKQYFYSTIWFTVYFVFVLMLNVIFSAYEGASFTFLGTTHVINDTNFFFLNSDFIPEKLGEFGKNVFRKTYEFTLPGALRPAVIHPPFQIAYFISYFLLGFGMWFIYVLFFKISEEHYELHTKLAAIRQDRIALESKLDGRSLEEPMDKNAGISYKLVDFSKKYAGRKVYAVEHANLEVHGGEIFGFLGPNGAGKSTIIKSTVGIQPISEGHIEICGYDVGTQPIQAKSLIGFVPDHYALYEKLSGREYLNYIADIYKVSQEDRDERLSRYIKLFELENAIDNKIKTYSHGMKQKITIMAALVHDPKIWILDEPLTGLDPQSIYQVKQCMIEHAKKGNIVFFSSHIIDIVEKLCDRIAIIKKGHILCVRDTQEVEKENGSLETYYLDMIGDTVTERK